MLKNIVRRNIREPLANIAVLVFAAVLTVVLCHLQRAQEAELKSFEDTYMTVPVYLSVTDLDGSSFSGSNGIEGWIADLFLKDGKLYAGFGELIKDLNLRVEYKGILGELSWEDEEEYQRKIQNITKQKLIGITTIRSAEELTPDCGGSVRWYEGYGEEVLNLDETVCLVPESYEGEEITLSFVYYLYDRENPSGLRCVYTPTFTVVGRYTDEGNTDIYCPYPVMEKIYGKVGEPKSFKSVSATLADNSRLDELRDIASVWFAEPNPLGAPTEWGKFGYEYYPYALDINDRLLQELEATMERSLTINRLSSALIFVMSALAGFLTGFLIIRARKREITLMRTIGCSNGRIYAEFALEQLACLCVGVLLGGSYAMWQPLWKLMLFVTINFAGLSTALVVFLNTNLLSTAKEDE